LHLSLNKFILGLFGLLLSISFDATFGKGTLSHAILKKVQSDPSQIVILDGVRWLSDEELIGSFDKKFMVYVTASAENRFERLKTRNEKVGEGDVTFEQFLAEEKVKTETLIPKIGKRADIKIENNGTFSDLEKQVKLFVAKL
jgi:uridine kinase